MMLVQNYVIGEVIGRGSYGEVTLATSKKDKKKYVIKKIDLHNASAKERTFAQQEVEILSKLRHPNIVSYKESFQSDEGHLSIVMGYCEGGDLYTKLKKQAKQSEYLTETQIVEWFVQIAMALQYMHDRNILHRDLKTQNIFLTKSKIIKLGDLGIARVLDSNCDMATTMIGTPYYMSPELFSNKPYNHKSDVWALGCCVYEMATLKHAFNAKDMNSLVYKILKGKTPVMPKHYSEELLEIIRSMLSYEPSTRPSASRILRHVFIKKHIAIFLEGTKNRQKRKNREETKKTRDESRKSQDETKSHVQKEQSLEESNAQAIVTASKVDIELVADEKNDNNLNKNNNNNNKHRDADSVASEKDILIGKKMDKNIDEIPEKSSPKVSSDRQSRAESSHRDVHQDSSPSGAVKNPSEVRKILHDRMRAKARLKEKRLSDLQKKSLDQERISSASSQEDRSEVDEKAREISNQKRSSPSQKSGKSRRPLPSLPSGHDKDEKPVLPIPRFRKDENISKQSEREGSCRVEDDKPKVSAGVPNMAARRKRRQKQRESQPQFSPPSQEKIESVVLSHVSHPRKSREEIIRNHLQRNSIQHEEKDVVDGPPSLPPAQEKTNQNSNDESSSENDDVSNPSASHGKGSDVMNLIDTLQATLKMDVAGSNYRKSPQESMDCSEEPVSPSVSGRLKDRITRLRRECIQGVGLEVIKEAYEIIDTYSEEEAEGRMMKLLGDRFEDFSGRIWQLKFCEEFK